MKKRKVFLILAIAIIMIGGAYNYYIYNNWALPSFINKHTTHKKYIIKKAGRVIDEAETLDEAIEKASKIKRSIAINTYTNEWVYSDFNPFLIITENAIHDFATLIEAIKYAKTNEYKEIYYQDQQTIIWTADIGEIKETRLDVPLIRQLPELPRGCEVTSLAMILKYQEINVDKMTLASQIKKETTAYAVEDGKIISGNPYKGFVGDMYNIKNFGYGVYHDPIVELARNYCGDQVADLTGLTFEEVLYILEQGYPIWVITNTTYKPLDDSAFEMWHTPTGIVKITYRLHSVVVTGVSDEIIYINDPLSTRKNRAVNKEQFKKAWEQMGNQAIAILE